MSHDLQDLLDRSFESSSAHLRSIMTAERRIDAEQLAADVPCPVVLNIATVTARGEPRISAVDGHFYDGSWHFTTASESPKARQLRARPAISASWTPRDGYGVFCHGHAVELHGAERKTLYDHFLERYDWDPETTPGGIYYARIDADWLVAWGMDEQQAD